jgi:hypothetical protein
MRPVLKPSYEKAERDIARARRNIGRAWRIIEEAKIALKRTQRKSLG